MAVSRVKGKAGANRYLHFGYTNGRATTNVNKIAFVLRYIKVLCHQQIICELTIEKTKVNEMKMLATAKLLNVAEKNKAMAVAA